MQLQEITWQSDSGSIKGGMRGHLPPPQLEALPHSPEEKANFWIFVPSEKYFILPLDAPPQKKKHNNNNSGAAIAVR